MAHPPGRGYLLKLAALPTRNCIRGIFPPLNCTYHIAGPGTAQGSGSGVGHDVPTLVRPQNGRPGPTADTVAAEKVKKSSTSTSVREISSTSCFHPLAKRKCCITYYSIHPQPPSSNTLYKSNIVTARCQIHTPAARTPNSKDNAPP